jgi:hypothetical protein
LTRLYREGLAVRGFVFNSDDSVSVEDCAARLHEWRSNYFNYIRNNISIGKAQNVDSVPSVTAFVIVGMKTKNPESRSAKETLILNIDERLKRLSDLMGQY